MSSSSECVCINICNIFTLYMVHHGLTTFKTLICIIEGSLEVKLPKIWTHGKAEVGRVREEKRRGEERRGEKRKSQKNEDAGCRRAKR